MDHTSRINVVDKRIINGTTDVMLLPTYSCNRE